MSYKIESSVGKVTILTVFFGVIIIALSFLTDARHFGKFQTAMATTTVATSVTVLNTPPIWQGGADDAEESPASYQASTTNSGGVISWVAEGKDNNGENYFLLICKTSTAPTPHGDAKPTCDTPENQWGVSATTTSETQARVSTTTAESWTESNAWFAWICDSNTGNARCNVDYRQGSGDSASPFIVNHRPSFTVYNDSGGVNPSARVTWTTTSSDPEGAQADDVVELYVCKTNSFDIWNKTCAGGFWCNTDTAPNASAVTSDPTCYYDMDSVKQDGTYEAYGFVVDEHKHAATGAPQATDSVLTVNNTTPTIENIGVYNTSGGSPDTLVLTTANGQTAGFRVKFDVVDTNSCQTQGVTDEILGAEMNLYRYTEGVFEMTNCDATGEYNTNRCYTDEVATGTWQPSCVQDESSCSGSGDSSVGWTCTFPLWYNASPTGAGTQYVTSLWRASVKASDNNFATSTLTDGTTGQSLQSLLAFDVPAPLTIDYPALEPGFNSDVTNDTTTLAAWGNVGLDEFVWGTKMCTAADQGGGCAGGVTRTILPASQKYSNAAFDYDLAGTALLEGAVDGIGDILDIHVPKTVVHTAPSSLDTYWGIAIPGTITLAGAYTGQNFIAGKVSDPANWGAEP